ncbi:hypothetical protein LMG28688_05327 [Paraburkholderia caffeinitolerans]|uniref:Uncharacterized protein n=1 Tax=Paraburkholderia caffeinitolerans TaxID=1723730 RepID=A0A6J5GPT9_9BURK|nr:hypothetical protein LMG28688_05327 [Paraburkholderia caffeinitolerans]
MLSMTKRDDHLTFDFTGMAPQAGVINCTYAGSRGSVMLALLPTLHGSELGKTRRVVERTISWLHNSADWASASNSSLASTRLSSESPAASYAGDTCKSHSVNTS